jgi:uncharacterized protein involved in exopolysaccharide biosynthesis
MLKPIVENKNLFITAVVVTSAIVLGVCWILPSRYSATSKILPTEKQEGMGMASLLNQLPLAQLAGQSLGADPALLILGMIRSDSVTYGVLKRCSPDLGALLARAAEDPKSQIEAAEAARDLLRSSSFSRDRAGIVEISARAETPERAVCLANGYVEALNDYFKETTVSRIRSKRLFVEAQLDEAVKSLNQIQRALISFHEGSGLVQIDSRFLSALDRMSEKLRQQSSDQLERGLMRELFLDSGRSGSAEGDAEDSRLSKISRDDLVSGRGSRNYTNVAIDKIPALKLYFLRAKQDERVALELVSMLRQRLELLKLEELDDALKFQVLERASPQFRAVWPRPLVALFLANMLVIVALLALLLFSNRLKTIRA